MKKLLFLTLAAVLLLPSAAGATSYFKAGQAMETNGDGTTQGDLYIVAPGIALSSDVIGDALAAAGNVLISGDVMGDIMTVGGNLNLVGAVGESLRAAGGNIIIAGAVGRDVVVAGGQVSLIGAGIGGDVMAGAGQLTIEAPISGNLRAAAGEVFINGPIAGDVTLTAEKITLGDQAVISGNLTYHSKQEAELKAGAVVKGEIDYQPLTKTAPVDKNQSFGWGWLALLGSWILIKSLIFLLTALILTALCHKFALRVVKQAGTNIGWELGRGFIVLIVMPIAAILLLISVLGSLFGILTGLAYIAVLISSAVFSSVVFGSWLFKKLKKEGEYEVTWKTTLSGLIALLILNLIPFIGWLISLLVVLVTMGALVKVSYESLKSSS